MNFLLCFSDNFGVLSFAAFNDALLILSFTHWPIKVEDILLRLKLIVLVLGFF